MEDEHGRKEGAEGTGGAGNLGEEAVAVDRRGARARGTRAADAAGGVPRCGPADTLFAEAEANAVTVLNARGDQTVHPALVEARQQGALYVKLIASLRIPDAEDNVPQRRGGARGAYGLRAS